MTTRRRKIKTLKELSKITRQLKSKRKTISLVTGNFDILHIDHINLLRFAKSNSDILVVVLDNDKTIKLTKGNKRPINSFLTRAAVIGALEDVDYVLCMRGVYTKVSKESIKYYTRMTRLLCADYLVTNPAADKYWKEKEARAKNLGIKLLKFQKKIKVSSTSIIDKLLEKEF